MRLEQKPGTIWIGRDRWGRVGAVIGAWACAAFCLVFPIAWPAEVLREKHPPVGVFVYLALAAVALIWTCYRGWVLGIRFDDHAVTVCNWFRARRAGWAEVSSFTDGTTDGRKWALTVLLRDGRGITATATAARPGDPGILTALRRAAARYEVPVALTGVAAERPHAWMDAADEARRQGAWVAVWLAVTVLAVAALVPLFRLGRSHSSAHHLGNYYPASFAAGLVVAGLLAAGVAWRKRQQVLRRRLTPAADQYGEGGWFAVPLPKKGAGFAPGLIARTEPRRDGLLLCYFFAPISTAKPTPGQLRELGAADAVLVQRVTGLAPKWPRVGRADGWDRSGWPVPAFGRVVKKTGQSFLDIYDDDLRFVGEEPTGRAELDGSLPPSELLSPEGAPIALAGLLKGKLPPGTPRRARLGVPTLLASVSAVIGLLLAGITLSVYLTQGSLIPVSASVWSWWCQAATRCDASVIFTAANGQYINATVPVPPRAATALVHGSGTIKVRYDSNDPASLNKLDHSMPFGTYVFLLVLGGLLILPILIMTGTRVWRRMRMR